MKNHSSVKRFAKLASVGVLVVAIGFSAGYGLTKAFVIRRSKPAIKKIERQAKPRRRLRQPVRQFKRSDLIVIEPAARRVIIESGLHTTDHYGYVTKRTPWLYMPEHVLHMAPSWHGVVPAGSFKLRQGRVQWLNSKLNGKPVVYKAHWPDVLHLSKTANARIAEKTATGTKIIVK